MELSPSLQNAYTKERLSAHEAQLRAQFIAWGPAIFQATRLMLKYGILELLREHEEGLKRNEIQEKTGLSDYAVKCLLEASLSIGTVLVEKPENQNNIVSHKNKRHEIQAISHIDISHAVCPSGNGSKGNHRRHHL